MSLRLQSLLLNVRDLRSTLVELAHFAASVIEAVSTSCGITLRQEDSLFTVASSDARAELLDETQYRAGDGPCLEALRTSRIVQIPDTRLEQLWPDYLPEAIDAGVRCSLSLPLRAGGSTFGAMNVYGFGEPQLFDEPQRRALELFAAQAAGTVQLARRLLRDGELLQQMEEALGSRSVIDQALGIIMSRQGCSAGMAFDLLRQESQHSHELLHDVAARLVTRTTSQPPEPGRAFDH